MSCIRYLNETGQGTRKYMSGTFPTPAGRWTRWPSVTFPPQTSTISVLTKDDWYQISLYASTPFRFAGYLYAFWGSWYRRTAMGKYERGFFIPTAENWGRSHNSSRSHSSFVVMAWESFVSSSAFTKEQSSNIVRCLMWSLLFWHGYHKLFSVQTFTQTLCYPWFIHNPCSSIVLKHGYSCRKSCVETRN